MGSLLCSPIRLGAQGGGRGKSFTMQSQFQPRDWRGAVANQRCLDQGCPLEDELMVAAPEATCPSHRRGSLYPLF